MPSTALPLGRLMFGVNVRSLSLVGRIGVSIVFERISMRLARGRAQISFRHSGLLVHALPRPAWAVFVLDSL